LVDNDKVHGKRKKEIIETRGAASAASALFNKTAHRLGFANNRTASSKYLLGFKKLDPLPQFKATAKLGEFLAQSSA
jgi:hypothetical protein